MKEILRRISSEFFDLRCFLASFSTSYYGLLTYDGRKRKGNTKRIRFGVLEGHYDQFWPTRDEGEWKEGEYKETVLES